jgi:hypothetical protein
MRREKSKLRRLAWRQFRAALCREGREEQAAQAEKKPAEVRAEEGVGDKGEVVGAGWDEAGLLNEDFGVDEEEGGRCEGGLSRCADDAAAGGLWGARELTERPEEGDEEEYRAVEALVERENPDDEESGYAEKMLVCVWDAIWDAWDGCGDSEPEGEESCGDENSKDEGCRAALREGVERDLEVKAIEAGEVGRSYVD